MKKILLPIFVLLVTFNYGQVLSGKNFIDQNYIEVTGTAEMEIIPNQIYLKVVLNEKDNKGKEKVEELEKRMMSTLKEVGVDIDKKVFVADFASNFKFRFLKKTDIVKRRTYQILLEDAEKVGSVIAALEKDDISNVSIDSIDHSEMEEFRKQVKIEAIKAAKEKAMLLTSAIDQKIGKAIYIQELNNTYQTHQPYLANTNYKVKRRAEYAHSINAGPKTAFKKIKLNYGVSVKFILQ